MNILNYLMIQYELMNDNEIGYIIKVVQGINMTSSVFIYHVDDTECINIYSFIYKKTNEC